VIRIVLLVLVLAAQTAFAQQLVGRVVGVADGDTVTVLDADHQQHKIRIAGIDAPEKKQPFGQRSKANLSALVFNREVEIVGGKRDRYGRTVAKVIVAKIDCLSADCPKTEDAGLRQIEVGLAWWYRKYAKEQSRQDRAEYEAAELGTRSHAIGLWSEKYPEPPWEFRHRPHVRATPAR
jgi:endonuclease YncB( thermonuclease family)